MKQMRITNVWNTITKQHSLFSLGSDAIIRQHKAACLRVTALLACKDLLWIGTSAGVVLTLPLPTITASTASLRNCPSATASFHGHTGHVRFLTAVEVPKEGTQDGTNEKGSGTAPSTTTAPLAPGTNSARDVLIISGGDGYEDFRSSSASESAGRDDSTNHLLIWRVWRWGWLAVGRIITFEFQALGSQTAVAWYKLGPSIATSWPHTITSIWLVLNLKIQSTSRVLAKNLRLRSERKPSKNTIKILFFS